MKNLTGYEFSEKLLSYVEKVEKQTGREAIIGSGTRREATAAQFIPHDKDIIEVRVTDHWPISPSERERLIVHKLNFGLLFYAHGYPRCKLHFSAEDAEGHKLEMLTSCIGDIVTDAMAWEAGFGVMDVNEFVKPMLKLIRKGRDAFRSDIPRDLRVVGVATMLTNIWGLQRYSKALLKDKQIIKTFFRAIKREHPEEWASFERLKEVIEGNDIFTPVGYGRAVREILKLNGYGVDDTYAAGPEKETTR